MFDNLYEENIEDFLDNNKSSFDKLFQKNKKLNYLENTLGLKIEPEHFIKWLKEENDDIIGNYREDVSSMCEYSCLYLSMLFVNKKLDGELKIYNGNYGFWEHYWMGYKCKGDLYFIDLTLMQFEKDAPKLSITKVDENGNNGSYEWEDEYAQDMSEYVKYKGAFKYYTNPHTMKKPEGLIDYSKLSFTL